MPPDPELSRRAHALLMRAVDLDGPARRPFVRRECADDPPLLELVLGLLDSADRSAAFLDRPALGAWPGPDRRIPDAVGSYLVVGVLGVGGTATVYEAIQEHPKRRVALKVLHQGMTSSDAYLRFRFETETLARLHHPGIAQIYEAGAAQLGYPAPSPFFAMELIPHAVPITDYAARHALPLRERVVMLASVCDAVHHGHQHGVIHRDLKPANVLIDGEGRAKVIDFGIARTTEAGAEPLTAVSDVRQLIGTLNYMSPEQCGAPSDIDIRTDVYSLGVMLYELSCGRLPHDLADLPLPAAVQRIVHEPVAQPGPWLPRGHRDLEAIILKAIEKEPDRRYESAAAFAADLRRSLGFQAIEARPPGLLDHFRLFARRHRTLFAAAMSLAAGLVLVAALSTGFALRLSDEVERRRLAEEQTTRERDRARWEAYTAQIAGALSAMNTGEFQQMRARLAAAAHQPRGWEWGFLSRLAERSASTVVGHDAMILAMAVSDDWTRLATVAADGAVRLWDPRLQVPIASFESDSGARASSVAFLPDGAGLACADEDGIVRLLRGEALQEEEVIARMAAGVRSVVVLPDGRVVAGAADGSTIIWTPSSRDVTSLPPDQPGGARGIALSPDGSTLATYNGLGSVCLRSAPGFSITRRLEFPGSVNQVRFSRDGRFLAGAGASGSVLVWNVEDGAVAQELRATQGVNTVQSLAFSNDGSLLAVGLVHRGILIFSLSDGRIVGELGGHTDAVCTLAFRPDDRLLLSASWDRTIRSWRPSEFASPGGVTTLEGHSKHVRAVAFSPDGSLLASVSVDGSLRVWDPDLALPIAKISAGGPALVAMDFAPDGRRVAVAGADRHVRIIPLSPGSDALVLSGHQRWVASVAFDPSGERVAAGAEDGDVRVWDQASPDTPLVLRGHTARVNSVRFSPDGAILASGSRDRTVRLWDARTGDQLACCSEHEADVFAVLFSHDGRRLYSGSRDQTVRVWDVRAGAPVATLRGHGQYVTCLALSPDGTRLAAGSWFGEIVLFDVATLDPIASFRAHDAAIRGIAFSPDGRWLASCSYDATVRLFDSTPRDESDAAQARASSARAAARRLVRPILDQARGDPGLARSLLPATTADAAHEQWIRKLLLSDLAPADAPR